MFYKHALILTALSLALCSFAQTNTNRFDDAQVTSFPKEIEKNYDNLLLEMTRGLNENSNCKSSNNQYLDTPESVYIDRLYSLPSKMELSYNPLVKRYIDMYLKNPNMVRSLLSKGQYYFSLFEQELDKEGLPLELKYLPVIESALNPKARSRVGATGLWQFMLPTGRMYDLEVNSLVDERSDPEKSTKAAVRYLKTLYNIYGDWNLVIAAYNCGPGNVNKAIRRSGGLTDYWTIYPYLPRETRGYVPIFIAATYVMSFHNEHGICPGEPVIPVLMDTIVVNKNIHFEQISDILQIPLEDIRLYNPQYKADIIPGLSKPYTLNLPLSKATAFIDKKDAILAHRAKELFTHRKTAGIEAVSGVTSGTNRGRSGVIYKVKRGDTLGAIARRYGVSVNQIKQWNGLKSNNLSIGRNLLVSNPALAKKKKEEVKKDVKEQITTNEPIIQQTADGLIQIEKSQKAELTNIYYKVKRGESLAAIAKKYNVSLSELKQWNSLSNNKINAGRTLLIKKIKYVEVIDTIHIERPEFPAEEIGQEYITSLLDEYVNRNEVSGLSTYPRISLGGSENDDNESRFQEQNENTVYHKVRIGETLSKIAANYHVTVDSIIAWNKLKSPIAKAGQRLIIYLPKR